MHRNLARHALFHGENFIPKDIIIEEDEDFLYKDPRYVFRYLIKLYININLFIIIFYFFIFFILKISFRTIYFVGRMEFYSEKVASAFVERYNDQYILGCRICCYLDPIGLIILLKRAIYFFFI